VPTPEFPLPLSTVLLSALALVAGTALAVQAPINATLARFLAHPMAAATVSFAAGAVILAVVTLAVARGPAPFAGIRSTPPVLLLAGGALGTFYVTTSIFLVPRIGAAALMALVIAGQLLAAAAIDHFGLFGVAMRELSVGRVAGLVAVALGALLVRFG
jgi:bacterial/archaeal transporter family-2 protein